VIIDYEGKRPAPQGFHQSEARGVELENVMTVDDIRAQLIDSPFKAPEPNATSDLPRGEAKNADAL
jgi:hypothetical protein